MVYILRPKSGRKRQIMYTRTGKEGWFKSKKTAKIAAKLWKKHGGRVPLKIMRKKKR